MLAMLKATDLNATYRITDEGIEFGLSDPKSADNLRLNLMALYGDFGHYVHTEETFATPEEQKDWLDLGQKMASAIYITAQVEVDGPEVHIDFSTTEDAIVFLEAMRLARNGSFNAAVDYALETKAQMRALRTQVNSGSLTL